MQLSTTEQKKIKEAFDKVKEEISALYRQMTAGKISVKEYNLMRIPLVEKLGTRFFYNDDGTLK